MFNANQLPPNIDNIRFHNSFVGWVNAMFLEPNGILELAVKYFLILFNRLGLVAIDMAFDMVDLKYC